MDMKKMKLPKLRRCCCCMPLRTGLLTWGYFNLIYHCVILGFLIVMAFAALILYGMSHKMAPLEVTFLLPVLVVCIITHSLLLVVAGHTDNVRMLKGLFITGTVLLIFEVLYNPCLSYRMIIWQNNEGIADALYVLWLGTVILEPFFQAYVLLLIRSMILHLEEEGLIVSYVNLNKNETETARKGEFL